MLVACHEHGYFSKHVMSMDTSPNTYLDMIHTPFFLLVLNNVSMRQLIIKSRVTYTSSPNKFICACVNDIKRNTMHPIQPKKKIESKEQLQKKLSPIMNHDYIFLTLSVELFPSIFKYSDHVQYLFTSVKAQEITTFISPVEQVHDIKRLYFQENIVNMHKFQNV